MHGRVTVVRARTLMVGTALALTALLGPAGCTPGLPSATNRNGLPSTIGSREVRPTEDTELGIAVPYNEARDTTQADKLAKWATNHLPMAANPSATLSRVALAASNGSDPYPGSAKFSTLILRADTQARKASDLYADGKFASADALAKKALADIDAARKVVEADFDAALAKAGPGAAYLKVGGTHQPAFVKIATLASAAVVVKWIDGDTVLTDKGKVRLVGVDAPEVSDKCSKADEATRNANTIAPTGSKVVLRDPVSVQDKDRYGRSLRYVETYGEKDKPSLDIGYAQIQGGLAVARYDGVDGFASHPRQKAYRAASQPDLARDVACYLPLIALFGDGDDGRAGRHVLTEAQKRTSRAFLADGWKELRSNVQASLKKDRQYWKENFSTRDDSAGDDSDSGGSGGPPGYTGPRCYAPGGKTWRPC